MKQLLITLLCYGVFGPQVVVCQSAVVDTTYNANGTPNCIKFFEDSCLSSAICFSDSGVKLVEETYVNCMLEGRRKTWRTCGLLRSDVTYSKGIPQGLGYYYNEFGKVEILIEGNGISHTSSHLYENEMIRMRYFYENDVAYRIEQYCESGQLRTIDYPNHNSYVKMVWFCNENIQIEGQCNRYESYVGDFIEYYPNGNIIQKGRFLMHQGSENIRVGYWTYFHENGLIKLEEKYSDVGVLLNVREEGKEDWVPVDGR
jgi:antitoxin component YwqK of YwqJK toxin-antitoxin module